MNFARHQPHLRKENSMRNFILLLCMLTRIALLRRRTAVRYY